MREAVWIVVALIVVAAFGLAACSRRSSGSSAPSGDVETAASRVEMKATIVEEIDRRVREGFEPREEIIEGVAEMVKEEYGLSDAVALVEKETDRRLEEHQREQASWPEVTDCEWIDRAFAALEGKGIVARQNFTCCQTCGNAEIGDEIEAFAKKAKPKGYTYYHMQDTESACESGSLYLAFGAVGGDEEDAIEVGNTIRDTLRENGLTVNWNGRLDKRICVTGLAWKKRRTPAR